MSTPSFNRPPELAWKWPVKVSGVTSTKPGLGRVTMQTLIPAVAAGLFFLRHTPVLGWLAVAIAGWMLLSGLFLPRAFTAVEQALKTGGRLAGLALTRVLLVAFFFLCFFPLGLMLRKRLRMMLGLGFDKNQPTYWQARPAVTDATHFQKQY